MPDAIGSRDLTLREKLKAAIQGDSKPGSVREHLAEGLTNLSAMTPLGVVFSKQDADAASQRGDVPGTLAAAAGMIPGGEGKGLAAALEALHPAEKQALDMAMKLHGSTEPTASNILEAAQYARRAINPAQTELIDSAVAKLFPENQYKEGTALSNEHLDQLYGRGATSVGEDLAHIAGGDPHKLNFIKNAMQDEGGNVPEDVAMTLVDHAKQKGDIGSLLDRIQAPSHFDPNDHQEIVNQLVDAHSIPEMLAMHYDLDPERFKNVYEMPSGVGSTRSRPTQ